LAHIWIQKQWHKDKGKQKIIVLPKMPGSFTERRKSVNCPKRYKDEESRQNEHKTVAANNLQRLREPSSDHPRDQRED
jgi:hypothetical protein